MYILYIKDFVRVGNHECVHVLSTLSQNSLSCPNTNLKAYVVRYEVGEAINDSSTLTD